MKNLLKTYNRTFTKGYLFYETNIINGEFSNHQGVEIGKIIDVNNKRIIIELTVDIHQEDAIRFQATNQGFYLNTLYDKNGLLTNKVSKNNICQIDNKIRIMRNVLLNTKILKTIENVKQKLEKLNSTFKNGKVLVCIPTLNIFKFTITKDSNEANYSFKVRIKE